MKHVYEAWKTLLWKYPALFFALLLLLGFWMCYFPGWDLLIPFFALLFPFIIHARFREITLSIAVIAAAFFYAHTYCPRLPTLDEPLHGKGYFHITHVKETSSPFTKSIVYTGTCRHFIAENGARFRNLPCTMQIKQKKSRFRADRDYWLAGTLEGENGQYFLKVAHLSNCTPVPNTHSFAEKRMLLKKKAEKEIKKRISKNSASPFLVALATGYNHDRLLSFQLGRVGLQHLLAVSGFHFGMVALFVYWMIRPFLKGKKVPITLLIATTSYFFYIGYSPSIFRAWIAISLFFLGDLLGKKSSGLNLLGVALLIELLFNPLSIANRGFVLSFVATASILLCFRPIEKIVHLLLPQKTLPELVHLSLLQKHLYLAKQISSKVIALTLSVHLALIPLILYYYNEFPLISLIYNLLLPACVTLSFVLLGIALLIPPPISTPFFTLAEKWTSLFLIPIENPWVKLHFYLQVSDHSRLFPLTFLSLLFFFMLLKKLRYEEEKLPIF